MHFLAHRSQEIPSNIKLRVQQFTEIKGKISHTDPDLFLKKLTLVNDGGRTGVNHFTFP